MTQTARLVLSDCRLALDELPEPPTEAWRRRWVALLALLRSVGLVLIGADHPNGDHALQQAIDAEWAHIRLTKPAPEIFWRFIEERNGILHQYQFTASQSVTVHTHGNVVTYNARGAGGTLVRPPVRAICTSTMANGPFAGRLPKDVAAEAIKWWSDYLYRVDWDADGLRAAGTARP